MRRRLRALAAAFLALPLALAAAPSAHAADPTTMTSGFYVDPESSAKRWAAANPGDGRAAAINASIANTPMARWFGSWSGTIGTATGGYVGAADRVDKLPLLVAYNIYNRDYCGGHSAGGAASPSAYADWIAQFAAWDRQPSCRRHPRTGLPRGLRLHDPGADRRTRGNAHRRPRPVQPSGPQHLGLHGRRRIRAGPTRRPWPGASTKPAVRQAHGFSLNISNYVATAENTAYGNAVNRELSSRYGYTKPFVVDTSRNGNGSNGQWCNPSGRRIGTPTQLGGGAEMLLWIKVPGESDGNCGVGGGSSAGQFLPEVAYKMIYGY